MKLEHPVHKNSINTKFKSLVTQNARECDWVFLKEYKRQQTTSCREEQTSTSQGEYQGSRASFEPQGFPVRQLRTHIMHYAYAEVCNITVLTLW